MIPSPRSWPLSGRLFLVLRLDRRQDARDVQELEAVEAAAVGKEASAVHARDGVRLHRVQRERRRVCDVKDEGGERLDGERLGVPEEDGGEEHGAVGGWDDKE